MKTNKILSLASALALGALSFDAFAIATIATGTNTAAAGATVTIPLTYTRPAGDAFNVFSATWRINHTNPPITFVSFAQGTPPTAASVACGQGGMNTFTTCVLTTNPPTAIAVGTYTLGTITYQIDAGASAGVQNLPTILIECTDAGGNEIAGACNATGGSITVTGGGVNTPPNIAYNPLTGTTINYTGAGTAAPIVATPSGGAGGGAAGTTTVGACTITGGGAAFPTTNIAQLSFVGATVTPQNINLPNCVPQAAAVNATLTCPESQGGGAAVNRVWTLNCPAGAVAVPPTLIYQPAPGNVTISGAVAASVVQTFDVSCNGVAGGSGTCTGSGAAPGNTARLSNLTVTGFSPSSLTCAFANEAGAPVASPLDFVAGAADPGDIRCSCVIPAINQNYIVSVTETPNLSAPGTTVQRQWNVTCGAGGVCGSLTANPASGAALNFTAPTGTTQTVAFTPAGGTVIAQSLSCTLGGANPGAFAFNSPAAFPISFPAGSTTVQNVVLGCTNNTLNPQNATLTCTRTCDTATTTFNYTLTCPPQAAPPVAESIPVPAMSESGRILLAALVLLLGLAVVGVRLRG